MHRVYIIAYAVHIIASDNDNMIPIVKALYQAHTHSHFDVVMGINLSDSKYL